MTATTAILENGMRQITETILIRRPPEDLYLIWRNLDRLPDFMRHLISVVRTTANRSRWIVRGPAGRVLEWDAEMTEKPEERTIAWHTLPDADVRHAGEVKFLPAPDGNGTLMHAVFSYAPPLGSAGEFVVRILGEDPARDLEDDLKRFKALVEKEGGERP